ncbi:aminotransferase class I/II-fold pyridoxal phosphate-dependent enzyme [Prosthecobacter vanneervenii]|uniref:8-amino-7-oxononanoate synthase n=1 Tax=Prosthecobacter vanneervenii TaxID=48466 RepID=A0A7W8DLD3_9BACT|nr:8-amino-7-oxononanoate synthase [Prosthecobacter vanneervenii]MBB5034037.1 8-amino-7-oxononanoate synthase [Prosthecobacter vanneervenii]
MPDTERTWNIAAQLDDLRAQELWRELRPLDEAHGLTVRSGDREWINFSSNDYLGLAHSQEMQAALEDGIAKYGGGSGASRLVCGTHRSHVTLEEALAHFKGTEAALTFSSGFAVALGTIPALVGAGDTIILDKLCHASLVDAARLSGATIRVFPHNHLDKLERLLQTAQGRVLVVTESIFSMDGDAALLKEIVELKSRHGAWLLVDEAHAVGVLGPQGRGLSAALGVDQQVDLHLGTLSKAFGLSGGYLAASRQVIDLLINRARSFIYSTAPPMHLAHALTTMIDLISSRRGDLLRSKLHTNVGQAVQLLKDIGMSPPAVQAAILPVIIGEASQALAASARLRDSGFLIPCIRYPTVARGSARLRITLSAEHSVSQITALGSALQAAL